MSIFGYLSGNKLLPAVFAFAAFSLLPAAAHADQFEYVFTGTASGVYTNTFYANTPFTLTFLEDTSTLDNRGGGFYSFDNTSATLVANGVPLTFNDVTLEVNGNAGFQNVDFYDSAFTNGLGLSMVTPVGYGLTTNLNVPVTTSNLTPTLGASSFSVTGGTTLQFTGDTSLGFTATDLTPAATPEPSSLLLMSTCLPGLALLRRRFLKA